MGVVKAALTNMLERPISGLPVHPVSPQRVSVEIPMGGHEIVTVKLEGQQRQ